jgi:23S rRNA pseudouridine2605 synthase
MKEGRKRQIRDTCHQIGLPVVTIVRVRIGSLYLGNLKPNQWRYLTPAEIEGLKSQTQTKTAHKSRKLEKRDHQRGGNK